MTTSHYDGFDMITIVERFSMKAIEITDRFKIFSLGPKATYLIELLGVAAYIFGVASAELAYPFIAFVYEFTGITGPCSNLIFFET